MAVEFPWEEIRRQVARRPLKLRQLAGALGVPLDGYPAFRQAVDELERAGQLLRLRGGRYGLPEELNLVRGRLSVNPEGFGFVTPDEGGNDIYIAPGGMGTALHGDRVLVRVHRRRGHRRSQEGTIDRVLARGLGRLVGTYRRDQHFGFVEPDEPRIPRDIYIAEEDRAGAKEGQKVVVELEVWRSEHLNPEGRITEVLGYPEAPGMDVLTIIKAHNLPTEFPDSVLKQAEEIPGRISPEELAGREDLRGISCFTIDPEDAKDFDDAVSIEVFPDGGFRLGVHIADVSFYVPEGSPLDEEALERGTSVYLVDRAIPMLPERLSGNICSLKPGEDRLTMSVLAELDRKGNVVAYRVTDSVIRSRARLTYEEAQAMLEGDEPGPLAPDLRAMAKLSRILTERRMTRGALDFDLPEAKVILDQSGIPLEIHRRKRLESHRLIEEFMIQANEIVARQAQSLGIPILYRVHDLPDPEKLEDFGRFVHSIGIAFGDKTALRQHQLQQILGQVEGKPEEDLVNELLLRSMKRAVYSPENIGHFGLALDCYTHFTSPIRRYPDLLVHRMLREAARGTHTSARLEELSTKLPTVGEIASERERRADEAEWDSIKVKQIHFMESRLGEVFPGIISDVRPFGFFVALDETLVEGLVHVEVMDDDYYIFRERKYCLEGRHRRRRFQIGSRVKVRLIRVDRVLRRVDFGLVD